MWYEFFRVFGLYIAYIVSFAVLLLVVRFTTRVPDYIFRKLLHIVAFTSIVPLVLLSDIWWISAGVEILFLVLIIAALCFLEKFPFYSKLFVEKGKHEVLYSFIGLYGLMTLFIVVFWGRFGFEYRYLIIASIMAWGPGDAVAAIVGRNIGKHKLQGKHIEGVKSVEGSVGMAITSCICVFSVLSLMTSQPWSRLLMISAATAVSAALTELFTKHGWDTISVPIISACILSAFLLI